MHGTFSKREKEKKKQQKRKEKEERRAERKANAKPGQALEEMMAYVDENGNISSTPPDPHRKQVVKREDIVLGSRNIGGLTVNPLRKGRVSYFNEAKGYGFIKDLNTQESIFVHANALTVAIKESDMVSFETENTVRGLNATQVKKI
ncbi:MAG TPA: cold shock domain-containing protein [Ohtaekwangia sp.]|uniref:cold-shock protein n=1 Tax=Ohtaekwangia sp. TaxID=2066019 RepID=UPI002F926DB1